MPWASLDGVELEYELRGEGDPVVLIHWGVCAAWAAPLLDAPALNERFQLLAYDRAGFGGSSRLEGPLDDGRPRPALPAAPGQLGIGPAHVVGHSSSALIALQLAADDPDVVRTLALLDPARPAPQTEIQAAFLRDVAGPSIARFREGDVDGAVDTWMRGVFGPGYRAVLDDALPGAAEQRSRRPARSSARSCPLFSSGPSQRRTRSASIGPCCSPRRAQRADVRGAPRAAALLATARRGVRPPRRQPPDARPEPGRDGRRAHHVLRRSLKRPGRRSRPRCRTPAPRGPARAGRSLSPSRRRTARGRRRRRSGS